MVVVLRGEGYKIMSFLFGESIDVKEKNVEGDRRRSGEKGS